MEGWLFKEGHTIKSWKKRWFHFNLNNFILSYYKNENKKIKCGEMLITKNTAISNLNNGYIINKNNLFAILSTENIGHNYLLLSAQNEEEKNNWIQLIQYYIDLQTRESDLLQLIDNNNINNNNNNINIPKLEGWLEKEGQFVKSWRRRWMIFDPQTLTLSYFVDSDTLTKKGEFKLTKKSTIISLKNGFSPGKVNLFMITSSFGRESILLSASSPEDRLRWINGIQQYLSVNYLEYRTNSLGTINIHSNNLKTIKYSPQNSPRPISFDLRHQQYHDNPYINNKLITYYQIKFWWQSKPNIPQYFTSYSNNTPDYPYSSYSSSQLSVSKSGDSEIPNYLIGVTNITDIPDMKWSIQDLLIDDNKIAVRLIISGSPYGSFLDIHNLNGSISFGIMALGFHTINDNNIQCTSHLEDWNEAIKQLRKYYEENYLSFLNEDINNDISTKIIIETERSYSTDDLILNLNETKERMKELITIFYHNCLSTNGRSNIQSPTHHHLNNILSHDYNSIMNSYHRDNKVSFIAQLESWWLTIPDMKWSIQDIIIDDNKIAVQLMISGSPYGTFLDVNNLDGSNSFEIMAIGIHTIINNNINNDSDNNNNNNSNNSNNYYQIQHSYHLFDWDSVSSQLNKIRTSELSVSAAYSFC